MSNTGYEPRKDSHKEIGLKLLFTHQIMMAEGPVMIIVVQCFVKTVKRVKKMSIVFYSCVIL